ncbi:uncharacterized protein LOC106662990 [Cimex lectularius]|uniref:Uncharacterized protein n=1 Tax=Cimex lectularius TaxID=79782 RepID=A0A8I6SHS6_CIMLE|nr:uncharacterized protein LOC106662990 [Cimex lectularius]
MTFDAELTPFIVDISCSFFGLILLLFAYYQLKTTCWQKKMNKNKDSPPTDENDSNTTPVSALRPCTNFKRSSIRRSCRRRPADEDDTSIKARKKLFKFDSKPADEPVKKVVEKAKVSIPEEVIAVPLDKVKTVEQVIRQRRLRI